MAVVTLMSDYGLEDHYVAALKGIILSENPQASLVDISHHIRPFDLSHASYVLSHAYGHFPKGTVHLISVDSADRRGKRIIAMEMDGHFFVGRDSGLFSIISDKDPDLVVEIGHFEDKINSREILAKTTARLSLGEPLSKMGTSITDIMRLISRQPKVTKREIVGNIIRVDRYGNLITNIIKRDYEKIQELNGNVPFEIQFGRQLSSRFQKSYDDSDPGEIFIIFNTDDKLMIGINKGNAAELLGLKFDSPVYIQFKI